jgi:hypothetical protein
MTIEIEDDLRPEEAEEVRRLAARVEARRRLEKRLDAE